MHRVNHHRDACQPRRQPAENAGFRAVGVYDGIAFPAQVAGHPGQSAQIVQRADLAQQVWHDG